MGVNKFFSAVQEQDNAFNKIEQNINKKNTSTQKKLEDEKKISNPSNTKLKNTKNKTTTKKNTTQVKKGRPCIDTKKGKKKNYCKTINIAVPKEDIDKIQMYALNARGINLTEYINLLIEQDLKKNLTKYKKEINRDKNFD